MCSWNVSLSYKVDQFPIQFIVNTWRSDGSGAVYVYDGPDSTYPLLQVLNDEFNYNIEKQPITTSSQPSMYIKFIAGNTKGRPFNFTVKIKGYCLPGTRSCGDSENCYDEHLACDGQWDCANGNDEKGCETKGCSSNEYWCGRDTNACYYENQRCDGNVDCLTSQHDETNCDARSCAEGTFFCPSSKRCMYERRRCDRELYCPDSDTYQQCTYSASRRVITAGIVGSLVCGLLLAIALGCSCKLYALRSAAHMRSRRSRLILPTPLGRIARELLQQEAPPSYSMTVQGVEAGSGRESGRSRSSNSRRRRERRRRRNREPQIRRAQPCIPSVSVISSGQHQENICVDALPSTTESAASAQLVQSSEAPSNSSRSTAIDDDVVLLLAEIGLVDFPSESTNSVQSDCTAALSEVPSTSAVNVDQTYMSAETAPTEENSQAPPLPKKKQIKPVFVEAPYDTVIVGDIPGCVYPNPPTYTEAVTTPTSTPIAVSHSSSENSCVSSPDTSSSTHKKPFFKKLWSKHSSKNFWKLPNPIQNIFSVNSSSSSYQELDDTTESDSCISNDHSRCMDIVDDPTLLVSSPVVAISETAKQPSPSITDNSATSSCRQSSQQLDGAELIRSGNYVASRGLLELSETGQPSAGVCLQQVPEQNPVSVESSLSISTASSTFAHDHLLQVHHDGSSQFEKPL